MRSKGRRWMVGRGNRGSMKENGQRDEKGNKAIKGRWCLAGTPLLSVPTETGERMCWPRRKSPSLLHQQHPLLFVRISLCPPQGRDQGPAQLQRCLILVGFCTVCVRLSTTPLPQVPPHASPGASLSTGSFPAIPGKIWHLK